VQPRVSAVQSGSVWLNQGGLGSCPLQARPGVVGSYSFGPFTGAAGPIQHSRHAQRMGGSTAPCPVKRAGGGMPGSCAGDGGCSGGRQRLPIGSARAKAGRQRLGRRTLPLPWGVPRRRPLNKGAGGGASRLGRWRGGVPKAKQIGTAGVVHISLLGVKSYDQGKMN